MGLVPGIIGMVVRWLDMRRWQLLCCMCCVSVLEEDSRRGADWAARIADRIVHYQKIWL